MTGAEPGEGTAGHRELGDQEPSGAECGEGAAGDPERSAREPGGATRGGDATGDREPGGTEWGEDATGNHELGNREAGDHEAGPREPAWVGDTNAELPMDSDVEADTALVPRPAHLRLGYLGLVALGGAAGTALRELITLAVAPVGGFPIAIFGINLLGAFVLGGLLELLALRGPDEGRRRRIRLLVGTGVLGGFTTYSSFATDTAQLFGDGSMGIAVLYAFLTIVVGALATWAGIVLAMRIGRQPEPRFGHRPGVRS